ncbi:hypothetical protein E2562_011226, partial [Oryza meyeriana var. granulata]
MVTIHVSWHKAQCVADAVAVHDQRGHGMQRSNGGGLTLGAVRAAACVMQLIINGALLKVR